MHLFKRMELLCGMNVYGGRSMVFKTISYVQGQSPKPSVREYFYYIDHQGQLFMDDAKVKNFISCFQDKVFLAFFFQRIRLNNTGRYESDFPYVSPCGRERNYIRLVWCMSSYS